MDEYDYSDLIIDNFMMATEVQKKCKKDDDDGN